MDGLLNELTGQQAQELRLAPKTLMSHLLRMFGQKDRGNGLEGICTLGPIVL